MSKKVELEIVGLSSSHAQTGSFALVLGEKNGQRRLPIIVGMFEAQSIAVEIEKIFPKRPLTHDLFKTFADSYGIQIKEIVITGLKEGVFFAQLTLVDEAGKIVEVDSRPSDAIALGIRFNAPIFTVESVLSEAGIILEESDDPDVEIEGDMEDEINIPEDSVKSEGGYKHLSADELRTQMQEAIDNEDYELAAKLRDELTKRK